jgi:3-oxoacyl-[acyl-carrier protein] reductase
MASTAQLEEKVTLVTGAAKWIGREVALRFAKLGANVIAADQSFPRYKEFGRNESGFNDTFEELESLGRKPLKFLGDLSKRKSVNELFNQIQTNYGRLDVLVNVAGGAIVDGAVYPNLGIEVKSGQSDPTTFDERLLDANIEMNYKTTVFCCQGAAPLMKKQHSGKIVNIASVAGQMIQDKKYAPYGASKAAVIHFSKYLALELAEFGIAVNCILPGPIVTERTIALWKNAGTADKLLNQIPMKRFGTTEEVANVVQFFSTDLSNWVTGQSLILGGGVELSWK